MTIQSHNNRIGDIIKWIEDNYPDYYEIGVVELTTDQLEQGSRYHTSTHDLIYNGINVKVIKAFLSAKKY